MRVTVRLLVSAVLLAATVPALFLYSGSWYTGTHQETSSSQVHQKDGQLYTPLQENSSATKHMPHGVISPESWKKHIQESCHKFGFIRDQNHFDPNILQHSKILVDDTNKLLYCQIPKVASTTWRRIFIVLSGRADTQDPMTLSANDVHHKYNRHLKYLRDFQHDDIIYRLNNYFKFVFVREPFERLLSAFRNKFVARTNSSEYFKKTFGSKIITNYRLASATSNTTIDVTFEEFIKYLTDSDKQIPMNEHWERFYKLCHPCWINYNFIGKLETLEEDSNYVLERNFLSTKVKMPSRADARYSDLKTNSYMYEYYSRIPKQYLQRLLEMYYADFVIFNFTVPDTIKYLMHRTT